MTHVFNDKINKHTKTSIFLIIEYNRLLALFNVLPQNFR